MLWPLKGRLDGPESPQGRKSRGGNKRGEDGALTVHAMSTLVQCTACMGHKQQAHKMCTEAAALLLSRTCGEVGAAKGVAASAGRGPGLRCLLCTPPPLQLLSLGHTLASSCCQAQTAARPKLLAGRTPCLTSFGPNTSSCCHWGDTAKRVY